MSANKRMSLSYFWRLARSRADRGHLSALRQTVEAAILRLFYGIGPGYYQMAALWDRDLSWHTKTQHLSIIAYRKILTQLNPINYRKVSQNKLAEKSMLNLLAIPTPEYLGYYHRKVGKTSDGMPLTDSDSLQRYLYRYRHLEKLCFKSIEGWGGYDFELVEIYRDREEITFLRMRTGEQVSIADFCKEILHKGSHASGTILERFLVQHHTLSGFNPSSLNTLRVWIFQQNDFSASVLLSYLRIGRAGAIIDNQSSGGIVAPIDVNSGILRAAVDGTPCRQIFPAHPDHGAKIEGIEIPFFKEAIQLASNSVLAFPNIRFAGVDVAIAQYGPKIIELNVSPDMTGAAYTRLPLKSLLRDF